MYLLLSLVYWIITTIRNKLFDFGIFRSYSIDDIKIICVGNITVGGTGKTPAVQYLAKQYINRGIKVGIVSRGYKGERKEDLLLVRDYDKIYAEAKNCGDEAYLHAIELPVPIMVGKNRYKACKKLKDSYNLDLIILDDGFQHRKLKRDENIILIDATKPFGDRYLLPKGRLREDLSGLWRASEFIITKADMVSKEKVDEIKKELNKYNKSIKVAKHGPVIFRNDKEEMTLKSIKGKKVLVFSALANPWQFVKTIEVLEPSEIKNLSYPDHYYYTEADFEKIRSEAESFGADYILSTEKDYVKYGNRFKEKNLFSLKIEFEILESN